MAEVDDILRKVQALLRQADHPNTAPAEAGVFRAKAEMLMFKYRIDEATFVEADGGGILPVWRTITVCNYDNEFRAEYRQMGSYIFHHCAVEGLFKAAVNEDGEHVMVAHVVGYESDLRFAEMLLTSATLAFGQRLEPKYDPELSEQVNAYLMRSAGMEGRRIAQAIYGRDDKNLRPKVRAMFKAEALARGEDPKPLLGQGVNVKLYRKSYAEGFATEMYYRLQQMRLSRGTETGALVLAGRGEAVKEAFYTEYPQYRPLDHNTHGLPGQPGQATCEKCAKAKSGYCADHRWLKPRKSDERRVNTVAARRGADAARTVDLGPSGHKLEA